MQMLPLKLQPPLRKTMIKARRPSPGVSASKEKASSNPFAKTTLVAETSTSPAITKIKNETARLGTNAATTGDNTGMNSQTNGCCKIL